MKRLTLILSILAFNLSAFCQTSEKEEAMEFAKKIVGTYFDFDCTSYLALWNDSIIIINPYKETVVSTVNLFSDTAEICRKFDRVRFDNDYTYQQYLDEYEIRIYSKEEMVGDSIKMLREDLMVVEIFKLYGNTYPDGTYFFSGWYRNNYSDQLNNDESPDQQRITHFRSWVKLIGKTQDGWKIVGTLP